MQHLGDRWISRGFIVEDDNIFEVGENVRPLRLSAHKHHELGESCRNTRYKMLAYKSS